jgi:hypothetical protein
MAKFKSAARSKPKISPTRGLIPCLILVLAGIALFSVFFYAMLKSGS